MAEEGVLQAAAKPQNPEQGKFSQWFNQPKTKLVLSTLLDAVGSLGAGIGSSAPGRPSFGAGPGHALGAYDRQKDEMRINNFTHYVRGRLEDENGKENPDPDRIMTLEQMLAQPRLAIAGGLQDDRYYKHLAARDASKTRETEREYATMLAHANDFYDGLDFNVLKELGEGRLPIGLTNNPEFANFAPYLRGPGGRMHGKRYGLPKEKVEGDGMFARWWNSLTGGDDVEPSASAAEGGVNKSGPDSPGGGGIRGFTKNPMDPGSRLGPGDLIGQVAVGVGERISDAAEGMGLFDFDPSRTLRPEYRNKY